MTINIREILKEILITPVLAKTAALRSRDAGINDFMLRRYLITADHGVISIYQSFNHGGRGAPTLYWYWYEGPFKKWKMVRMNKTNPIHTGWAIDKLISDKYVNTTKDSEILLPYQWRESDKYLEWTEESTED